MHFEHILRSSQFQLSDLNYIFSLADKIRNFNYTKQGLLWLRSLLPHKRAMLFFSQPSTRTFLSFQSACHILGMQTSEIRDPSTSSEKKGESIEDSMRTFSSYVDLIIMRSASPGLCERIADVLDNTKSWVPIINAGSGPDEHPTQALLDLYTLQRGFKNDTRLLSKLAVENKVLGDAERRTAMCTLVHEDSCTASTTQFAATVEFGKKSNGINGKTICMVGDLKRGRTVRSLSHLLTHYTDVKIIFVSPPAFSIPDDLRAFLQNASNVKFFETTDFINAITEADAIYMTRIQDEYDDLDPSLKNIDTTQYHLKHEHLTLLKPTCKILHPMPRRQEIDIKIDHDLRAEYWNQQRNGMWIRTALIAILLNVATEIMAYSQAAQTPKIYSE